VEVIFERTGSLDMIDHSKVRQNFFSFYRMTEYFIKIMIINEYYLHQPYILHGRVQAARRLVGEEEEEERAARREPLGIARAPPIIAVTEGDDEEDGGGSGLFPSSLVQLTTTAITTQPHRGDGDAAARADATAEGDDAEAAAFLSAPVLVLVEHLLQTTEDYYLELASRLAHMLAERGDVALPSGNLGQLLEQVREKCSLYALP